MSQAYESGSKTLKNTLSQAKESGSKIAKVLLSCLVTAVSKTIYKFLTPIVLFLIAYAFYYNYFVLHSGVVSNVISCIFGSLGYVYNVAASAMNYILRKNSEQKNEEEDEKKVPELITVEELEEEVKNIENELKSKKLAENVVGKVKNKIDELKSRINATRDGFINGLKYYITTLLLFRKTRYEYNRLEDKLNSLMKCSDIIIEISQFNNLIKNLDNFKNDNSLTLRGLLSNKEELNKDFTKTLEKIRLLESNEYKELGNIAQSLKIEVQRNYLILVRKVAEKQFYEIMKGNGEAGEFSTLLYDVCTNTKWPKDFLKKIEKIGEFYLEKINVALLNEFLDSTVKNIAPPNEVKNIYNEIEEIESLLSSDFFTKLFKVLGYEKEVKDQSISLLDKIYRNYDEIEEKYKSLKQMISKYKISLKENKKIKEKKELFEAICGEKSVIRKAKGAYMEVDKFIKNLDTKVETKGKDIFGYIESIKSKINNVLVKLKNELENLKKNGNSEKLNRVLEKKISNEKSKYLKIYNYLESLYKKIGSWKKSVESKKGYEQIANNTGKDIKDLAAEICNSEEIEKFISERTYLSEYKKNLLSIFSKEKNEVLSKVKAMLSSVKKEINDKKDKLNTCIKDVRQFLENPNLGDSKTKCDELEQILKEINDFAKEKTNKELLFYPENTGIEKVNNLANLLKIYSKTNEILNQKNVDINKLLNELSIFIKKFKSINSENYYSIYCKYCVDQIKIIINKHLESNEKINYATLLTNLEKINVLLPNNESKSVLEEAINTLKTNWNSTLNGYLKDYDGKITMSNGIENIVNKDVYSILNKTIEYINEAAAATRLEKKDNTTAEYLIKLFNKINEADKNLKILNTDYKIEISLLNEKIEAINSYIKNCLKDIDDKFIFEKFFNDFAYSLKNNNNNNNEEAERLFSNMETFFSKFYKDSEICKFFSNSKGLKKDIEDILLTKDYEQIKEFGNKYRECMPENIKKIIADCFEKETENLLNEYLNTEDGVFYDEDDTSRGRKILKSIHFNIIKFKAICGTDFSNGLDICIVHVLNKLENPSDEKSSNFSTICNELIEKASEYNENKSTIFEDVIVKLWCDFISYKNDVDKGDVVVSYVEKFPIKRLENRLQKDNFEKLSNTIESIKKDNDSFSKIISRVFAAQISCFEKSNYY